MPAGAPGPSSTVSTDLLPTTPLRARSWSSQSSSPTPCATAESPTPLDLTASPEGVEVAVHDSCPQGPRLRVPDLHGGTGGFGWPMVNHLAHVGTVTRQAGGKTVSALLPR